MSKAKFSVVDLLAKAEDLLERHEHEAAVKFLQRALQQEPENVTVMDTLGEALLELGRPQDAFEVFSRSASLAPDENPSKWMYMGQLQGGAESVQCFQKGIDLLTQLKSTLGKSKAHKKQSAQIDEQISTAYCSMAELYTTDLCDEPQAESECERLLQGALVAGPTNPQAHQALCNLRLIQQRVDEARAACLQTLALLDARGLGPASDAPADDDEAADAQALFEFRVETAKMCLECSLLPQCQTLAERLLNENDEELQLYYLAGMAAARLDPPDVAAALEHLTHTLQELEKTGEDPELAEEVRQVVAAMQQLQQAQGAAPAAADDDEDKDDEDQEMDEA